MSPIDCSRELRPRDLICGQISVHVTGGQDCFQLIPLFGGATAPVNPAVVDLDTGLMQRQSVFTCWTAAQIWADLHATTSLSENGIGHHLGSCSGVLWSTIRDGDRSRSRRDLRLRADLPGSVLLSGT